MARVFFSFLGTNRYVECNYTLGKLRAEKVRFIQQALVELLCQEFTSSDRIVVFVTAEARRTNWLDSPDGRPGLRTCLSKTSCPAAAVVDVDIPQGDSEEEIWQIFSIMYDTLRQDDEIVLDITHGFRSLPLLGVVLLNYARFLKNITIKGIY